MATTRRTRPRDPNQLGKFIVDLATREAEEPEAEEPEKPKVEPVATEKDLAAVALGRRGGLKGGKARAASMTPEERSEAARKAAGARWAKREEPQE